MKVVLAFDSFKGSLSAVRACDEAGAALRELHPGWQVVKAPMADGGEGTAEALVMAGHGQWRTCRVMGPLPDMEVEAGTAWFPRERSALVEMASASGITHVRADQLNPMLTTTFGTGQLLRVALDDEPALIRLAVGGSATTDGGVGAAMALGWRFVDEAGRDVGLGGAALERIRRILTPVPALRLPPVEVLCDVNNPLCGPEGAAAVYGPQKGATPDMVERLDRGLCRLAELVKRQFGLSIEGLPGAGAAGGLAGGAVAFLGGRLVPGIGTIIRASGLERELREADWVITGEGSFDAQSFRGKVVSGVLEAARAHRVKVAVMAGRVAVPEAQWRQAGVSAALALAPAGMPTAEAMARAGSLLRERVREFMPAGAAD